MSRVTQTTNDEKMFLDGLGSFYQGLIGRGWNETEKQRRVRLLQNYIASIGGRKVWGAISRPGVITHAHKLLQGGVKELLIEERGGE